MSIKLLENYGLEVQGFRCDSFSMLGDFKTLDRKKKTIMYGKKPRKGTGEFLLYLLKDKEPKIIAYQEITFFPLRGLESLEIDKCYELSDFNHDFVKKNIDVILSSYLGVITINHDEAIAELNKIRAEIEEAESDDLLDW